MDEREELKMELEQELQLVKYRQKMLDIMETKLLQIREVAEQTKWCNFTSGELGMLNAKLKNLGTQVRALDEESRKMEDGKISE